MQRYSKVMIILHGPPHKRLESRGLLGEVLLPLLQLRDVRIDRDSAAVLGPSLADHDLSPVASPLHLRLTRVKVSEQAFGHPFAMPVGQYSMISRNWRSCSAT